MVDMQESVATTPVLPIPVPSPSAPRRVPSSALRRIRICYQDEEIKQRSQQNAQQLLELAQSPTCSSRQAFFAKKALKYRKVWDRMTGVDVTAPSFDVSEFLGVDWHKTPSLKAYCMRPH